MLTQARLKEVLRYDADTGLFTWRKTLNNRRPAGTIAGCLDSARLRRVFIGVDGRMYLAHRLAWLYVNGVLPSQQIDHINGDSTDNRIRNLRQATNAENHQNLRRARNDSSTKLIGVRKRFRKWAARITVDGHTIHLGTFKTAEAAHAAYLRAKRKLHPFGTL